MEESNERVVPTQERNKPLPCKLGFHKWSRHYEIQEYDKKFHVCVKCGKWRRNRSPES